MKVRGTDTSCAAGMYIRPPLLVLLGSLATLVTSGRRVPLRLRLPWLTGLSLMLLSRARRMVRTIATTVSPSAAFCTSAVGADLLQKTTPAQAGVVYVELTFVLLDSKNQFGESGEARTLDTGLKRPVL